MAVEPPASGGQKHIQDAHLREAGLDISNNDILGVTNELTIIP